MSKYAIILYEKIHEIIQSDTAPMFPPLPSGKAVEVVQIPDGVIAYVGWDYDHATGTFSGEVPPEPSEPSQDEINRALRDEAAATMISKSDGSALIEHDGVAISVNAAFEALGAVEVLDAANETDNGAGLRAQIANAVNYIHALYPVSGETVPDEPVGAVPTTTTAKLSDQQMVMLMTMLETSKQANDNSMIALSAITDLYAELLATQQLIASKGGV